MFLVCLVFLKGGGEIKHLIKSLETENHQHVV